jgi:hypothetical protein
VRVAPKASAATQATPKSAAAAASGDDAPADPGFSPTGRRRRSSAAAATRKAAWTNAFYDIGTSSSSYDSEREGAEGPTGGYKGKRGAVGRGQQKGGAFKGKKKKKKAASDSESGSDWAAEASGVFSGGW